MTKKQSTDEPIKLGHLYDEFNKKISEKYNINEFKSVKATKNYAFNIAGVPDTCDYLEVRYAVRFSSHTAPIRKSSHNFSSSFNFAG